MNIFTVISQADTSAAHPVAVIAGRTYPGGEWQHVGHRHVTHITADNADAAANQVRDAARLLRGAPRQDDGWFEGGDRWTVIGLADLGPDPSLSLLCAVAGEHEVQGHWDSMLSHRWVRVVDASTVEAAYEAAWKAFEAEHAGDDW